MKGEFLSIDTIRKIQNLEKDKKRCEQIICNYDIEVNSLFNIIKDAYDFIDENKFDDFGYYKELKNVLATAFSKESRDNDVKFI